MCQCCGAMDGNEQALSPKGSTQAEISQKYKLWINIEVMDRVLLIILSYVII